MFDGDWISHLPVVREAICSAGVGQSSRALTKEDSLVWSDLDNTAAPENHTLALVVLRSP